MKYTNDINSDGGSGSIRRTLNIGNYESLTFESPILQETSNQVINFWKTIEFVNTQLIEWANHIVHAQQTNHGKSHIDRLLTEISYCQAKITQLNNQGE
jgi:hypothetical protein